MPRGGKRQGAGRPAGSREKLAQGVSDRLELMGYDPIESMVEIARQAESEGDTGMMFQCAKELANYVAPKRKSIEVNTSSTHEEWLAVVKSAKSESKPVRKRVAKKVTKKAAKRKSTPKGTGKK